MDFTPPHLHELQEAMMQKRREGFSDVLAFEWDICLPSGQIVTFDIRATLLTKNEKPSGVLFVAWDITERKKAAEALQQRANELTALNALARTINATLAFDETVNAALQGIFKAVCPDLIFLFLRDGERLILKDVLPAAEPLRLENIPEHRVGECLCGLTVREKKPVFSRDIRQDCRCAWEECKRVGITSFAALPLISGEDESLLNIQGSPVHLEKTLMNLVANALESIAGTGEVTVRTRNCYLNKPLLGYDEIREGDYAVLTVSDTGMGIPAGDREKIFEPFYTKKAMGRRSGTGLGLAIVWGAVKDHNGYIDVHSEMGEGTTFTLYFPVTREEMTAPLLREPIKRYMGRGESVLVVDDIAEQREIAASLLIELGYHVRVVASGEEAVEYIQRNRVDILVLDMIMTPGIDGLETYQRILAMNPQQKAILVSGFSETERIKEAQKLGAGAYVKKPYIVEKIGVAIREELDKK